MYVHPMILTHHERTSLTKDLFDLELKEHKSLPATTLGSMIKKYFVSEAITIDIVKIINYLREVNPFGTVRCNLGEARRTLYEVRPETVSLGAPFLCEVASFV